MSGVSDRQQNGYECLTTPICTILPRAFSSLVISLSASLTNLPAKSGTSDVYRPLSSIGHTSFSPFRITPCVRHTL